MIIIAIVVVCATNLDSIAIARAFYASGAVRAAVVQQASESFCSRLPIRRDARSKQLIFWRK
ncbi:MAG TPA: hypothetical protein VI036_14660 [Propionibacteriaceae bacterium]